MTSQLKWYNTFPDPYPDIDSEERVYVNKYRLHAACLRGDLSKVQEFCRGPASLESLDSEDRTPLICALKKGHLNVVQFILERSGNIDKANHKKSRTTLHVACEEGMVHIVKWLLENGANPNSRDKEDYLPTYFASQLEDQDKKLEIIKLLLDNGADVSALSNDFYSPAIDAFCNGDLAMAKLYVEHNLDLYKNIRYDCSPLYWAVESCNEELVRYLNEIGVDFKDHQKVGFDSFILACTADSVELLEFIWKVIYNKQIPDETKSKAIHKAAMQSGTGVLKFLLDIGCNIETPNGFLETPLQSSILSYRIENAQFLLDSGADPNAMRWDGKNALHLYCENIKEIEPILSNLITSIQDINATDKALQTSLHCAATKGSSAVLQFLIDRGADLKAVDLNKRTVLHCLCSAEKLEWNSDVFKRLVEAIGTEVLDDKRRTPLHYAAENNLDDLFDSLIAHGANVYTDSDDKGTVLHHVLCGPGWYRAKKLIFWGAGVNIPNNEGKTPLHCATQIKCIAELLLDKGADIHAANKDGLTALHYAVDADEPCCTYDEGKTDRTVAVGFLIDRGSDVNVKDKRGRTPLHLAYLHGRSFVTEVLISRGADKNAVDNEGKNILHYAAQQWQAEGLPFDVNLNVRDKNGHRPLYYSGKSEVLQYLFERTEDVKPDEFRNFFPILPLYVDGLKVVFERGATVDTVDENGNTILHKYASWGLEDEVEFLLKQGAVINAKNKDSLTPLQFACKRTSFECLKVLIDHGADLKAEDKDKRTPLDYIRERRRVDMLEYLLSKDIFNA